MASRTDSDPPEAGPAGHLHLCNLDGEILPAARARIPVSDRGFLFGDSVYEAFRTHDGVPFAWQRHLRRLRDSAAGIGMPLEAADDLLIERLLETASALRSAAAAPRPECALRLIVTRGDQDPDQGLEPGSAPGAQRIVILARPLGTPERRQQAARVRLVERAPAAEATRRDPSIKSGNYLSNLMGHAEAVAQGATDCVFFRGDTGEVTEAATANLFVVQGGRIRTPPCAAGLLAGVTRAILLEAAATAGMEIDESPVTAAELRNADEAFLTATSRGVEPISQIDGRLLEAGVPGPVTREVQDLWIATVAQVRSEDRAALPEHLPPGE